MPDIASADKGTFHNGTCRINLNLANQDIAHRELTVRLAAHASVKASERAPSGSPYAAGLHGASGRAGKGTV
jgi:hypothetical protein